MSVNKIIAAGRLTADPALSDSASGAVLCHFTVACDTRRKDASGNPLTNFYRCTAWRGLAESCARFLHKGDKITVVGDLLLREYTDRNGQPRAALELDLTDVEFPPVLRPAVQDALPAFPPDDELPI